MALSTKEKAIHEAGHAVIAKLFEDALKIEEITLNPQQRWAGKIDTTLMAGGIKLRPNFKEYNSYSIDAHMFTLVAGACSLTLYRHTAAEVKKNLNYYIANPKLLEDEGAEGDMEIFERKIPIAQHWEKKNAHEIISTAVLFVLSFMLQRKVWTTIETVADKLISKKSLTIKGSSLNLLFYFSGFTFFLLRNRFKILTRRIDLSRKQKTLFVVKSLLPV